MITQEELDNYDAIQEVIYSRFKINEKATLSDIMNCCKFRLDDLDLQKRVIKILQQLGWEPRQGVATCIYWVNPNPYVFPGDD